MSDDKAKFIAEARQLAAQLENLLAQRKRMNPSMKDSHIIAAVGFVFANMSKDRETMTKFARDLAVATTAAFEIKPPKA